MRQGRPGQKPDQEVLDRYRAQAVEALLEATSSPHWQVRASAAVGLGPMAEPTAYGTLQTLAVADPVQSVRIFALVSLALADPAGTEELLRGGRYDRSAQREAALVALGLLRELGPDAIVGLQQTLGGPDVAAAAISAWALRRQSDPANDKLLQGVLGRTPNPQLASEAILSLDVPRLPEGQITAALLDILLGGKRAESMPAWAAITRQLQGTRSLAAELQKQYEMYRETYEQRHERWKKEYGTYLERRKEWRTKYNDWLNRYRELKWEGVPRQYFEPGVGDWAVKWSQSPWKPPRYSDTLAPADLARRPEIVIGESHIYRSRLRGSAAIALGHVRDPRSRQALIHALQQPDDRYSDLYKGFALVSLGQLGDPESLPALVGILRRGRLDKGQGRPDSPLRGYAALALGLYARRDEGPQPQDRPQYDRACQLLAERMADRRETEEVRSAAALALGLTRRTENLKHLQAASKAVGAEEVLIGYTLLARGMLGDANILDPARRFLAVSKDKTDSSGILGRRAAVLALGVLGRQEGIPILVDAWHLSYYVNREAALAMSLCQAYNVTEPLVKLLKESNAPGQSFAAQCLGELFAAERPSRLSRILNGTNYTMKNPAMISFQMLANEFLFAYLIPATEASSGERWR